MSWKFMCSLVGLLSVGTMSADDTQYGGFTVRGDAGTPYYRALNYGIALGFKGVDPTNVSGTLYADELPGKPGPGDNFVSGVIPLASAKKGVIGMSMDQFADGMANVIQGLSANTGTVAFLNDGNRESRTLQNQIKGRLGSVRTVDYGNPGNLDGLASRIPRDNVGTVVVGWTPRMLTQRRDQLIGLANQFPDVNFVVPDSKGVFLPAENASNVTVGWPLMDADFADGQSWDDVYTKANDAGLAPGAAFIGYGVAQTALYLQNNPGAPLQPGVGVYQNGNFQVVRPKGRML